MGQLVGKATLHDDAKPFVNAPRKNVFEIWEAFNLIAEGFGLSLIEVQEMIEVSYRDYLGVDEQYTILTEKLYHLFDTKLKYVVDSFEFLSTLAIVSDMPYDHKLIFVFGLYDFDESGLLTVDEVTLALRAAVSGLCKISSLSTPSEDEIEKIVATVFQKEKLDKYEHNISTISKDDFVYMASNLPELKSWMNHFDDHDERGMSDIDKLYMTKSNQWSREQPAANIDIRSFERTHTNIEKTKIRAWEDMITLSKPSTTSPRSKNNLPNANAKLEWIYGRNTRLTKGNVVLYSKKGEIVYPAGSVVVKLHNLDEDTIHQSYFMEHKAYVSCLTILDQEGDSSSDTIFASSELGMNPFIKIWKSEKMKSIQTIRGIFTKGVQNLDFSPTGKLLMALGADFVYHLAIYRWREGVTIFTTNIASTPIYDCKFLGSDQYFGVCGYGLVHFWDTDNSSCSKYDRQRGVLKRKAKSQHMLCISYFSEKVITGAKNGQVFIWEGRSCVKVIDTNRKASITSMYVAIDNDTDSLHDNSMLHLGTSNGQIHLWNAKLESKAVYSITPSRYPHNSIDSLCWDNIGKRILVGLESADVLEINDMNGSIIREVLTGHWGAGLNGLATNPVHKEELITVGEDATVRLWNSKTRKLLRMRYLQLKATCVCYNPDGENIAVGFDTINEVMGEDVGGFMILEAKTCQTKYVGRDMTNKRIIDCKYTKAGNLLALCGADGNIYIYDAVKYTLYAKAQGHESAVTHIDFGCVKGCETSSFLQSNSVTGEVMFWNIHGKKQTPGSQKTTVFESRNCPYTWELIGAHRPLPDQVTIQACDISSNGDFVALVDNIGRLCLHSFPVTSPACMYSKAFAHGGNIANVKFSSRDEWIFTVGSLDTCLIQWRFDIDPYKSINETHEPMIEQSDGPYASSNDITLIDGGNKASMNDAVSSNESKCQDNETPPWYRSIVAPSKVSPQCDSQPTNNLLLEKIYGYSGSIGKNNIFIGFDNGSIIYPVGITLVSLDLIRHDQKFYQGCTSQIMCVTRHPLHQQLCAIGQAGPEPCIHIINYENMSVYKVLQMSQQREDVTHISFDPSGEYILSLSADQYHSIVLFHCESGYPLVSTQTSINKTFDIQFNNTGSFVQCGHEFLRFWSLNGSNLSFRDAIIENEEKIHIFYSVGWVLNDIVVGCKDGYLIRFQGRRMKDKVKVCESGIYAIHPISDDSVILGSLSGKISIWYIFPDSISDCRFSIQLPTLHDTSVTVKSICWESKEEKVFVGTDHNEIWEVVFHEDSNASCTPIIQNHFGESLGGLSVCPARNRYATTGDDKTLRLWNIEGMQMTEALLLENKSRACSFSPDGDMIAVGYGSPKKVSAKEFHGKWVIMLPDENKVIFETRDSRKMITEIKWSNDGVHIAVGSDDHKVYLYDIEIRSRESVKASLSAVIDQHQASITNIDFSVDSKYMQVTCADNDLRFYESETGVHVPGVSRLKDVDWGCHNCVFGWPVQGLEGLKKDERKTECIDCFVNPYISEKSVIGVGGSDGSISLVRYPCLSTKTRRKVFLGHKGRVAKVKWIVNGTKLISVGFDDLAIMIWNVSIQPAKQIDEEVKDDEGLSLQPTVNFVPVNEFFFKGITTSDKENKFIFDNDRPWVASVVAPSKSEFYLDEREKVPDQSLMLTSIYGLETQTISKNVLICNNENILYTTSSVAVVYDINSDTQSFFNWHDYAISAVTISDSGRLVASGDSASKSNICVWDASSLLKITAFQSGHREGIISLSFSHDSTHLISIGSEAEHFIFVWKSPSGEWFDKFLCCKVEYESSHIYFCNIILADDRLEFVTGDEEGLKFWNKHNNVLIYAECEVKKAMFCGLSLLNSRSRYISGGKDGCMYVWQNQKLNSIINAHSLGVTCICHSKVGVISGSFDNRIIIWSDDFQKIKEFNMSDEQYHLSQVERSIHSVAVDCKNSELFKVLYATKGCDIVELSVKTGNILHLSEGHSVGSLQGLACHPSDKEIFATCGADGMIYVWSLKNGRSLKKLYLSDEMKAICWSNDGREIIVGISIDNNDTTKRYRSGKFMIIDYQEFSIKSHGPIYESEISCMKYSPDGKLLAVATNDHKIHIYDSLLRSSPKLKVVIDDTTSSVCSIDFSIDSCFLQIGTEDHRHFKYKAENGDLVTLSSQVKDILWDTYTCRYGWHVQGIWPSIKDEEIDEKAPYPICVDRSNKQVLAVGMSDGEIRLYKYPVITNKDWYWSEKVHVGSVSKCQFNCDGSFLVCIGENDKMISTWEVKEH